MKRNLQVVRHTRSWVALGVLVAAAFVFVGCTQGSVGVFASIERERKIDDFGLDNTITPSQIIRANGLNSSGASTSYYYLAAGDLYVRNVSVNPQPSTTTTSTPVTPWTAVTVPSALSKLGTTVATGVAATTGGTADTVLVGFTPANGSFSPAVYQTTADGSGTGGISSPTWNDIPFSNDGGSTSVTPTAVGGLFTVGPTGSRTLFAAASMTVSGATNWYLYYFDSTKGTNGTLLQVTGTGNGSETQSPVTGAAYDTATSTYWFSTAGELLSGTGTSAIQALSPQPTDSSSNPLTGFGDIAYVNIGTVGVYVTTKDGSLYGLADSGGSWFQQVKPYDPPNTSTPVRFTRIAEINGASSTSASEPSFQMLLLGTQTNGYYQIVVTSGTMADTPSTPDAAGSNYQASDMHTAAVTSFLVDQNGGPSAYSNGAEPLVFIGTASQGLWEGFYYNTNVQWVRD